MFCFLMAEHENKCKRNMDVYPFARAANGKYTTANRDPPFTCMNCGEPMVYCKTHKRVRHFDHGSTSFRVTGGFTHAAPTQCDGRLHARATSSCILRHARLAPQSGRASPRRVPGPSPADAMRCMRRRAAVHHNSTGTAGVGVHRGRSNLRRGGPLHDR